MKTAQFVVSNGQEIVNMLGKLGYYGEEIQGCLQDEYFFRDMEQIRIGRYKPRKFVMVLEHYENCWSSNHLIIMTDDEEFFEKIYYQHEKNYYDETEGKGYYEKEILGIE